MDCSVYILFSVTLDRYYVGHTCMDMEDRLRYHLYNHGGFTSKAKDWRIAWTESHSTKELAYTREREIKRWKNREKIEELIRG